MAHQDNHDIDHTHQGYGSIEQWWCFECNKPKTASRPPVFNPENCSCVEVGTHSSDSGEHSSHPMVRELPYNYNATSRYYTQRPESYASSSRSATCPEGPERQDPNYQVQHYGNTYLPMVEEHGLNEVQHNKLSASSQSEMSIPMQRFLGEREYYTEPEVHEFMSPKPRFLSQGVHITSQDSKKVHRSKQSYMSVQSSGSGEGSFESWGVMDPFAGAGTWTGSPEDPYAMTLSDLTDFHLDDDTN